MTRFGSSVLWSFVLVLSVRPVQSSKHFCLYSWLPLDSLSIFFLLTSRPDKLVWHGSSAVGVRLTTNYCEAWRTADMAVTGQAALLQTGRLLGQHTRSCSNHYIVLCIENTYVGNTLQKRTWRHKNTHTHDKTHMQACWKCTNIKLKKQMEAHKHVTETYHCVENPYERTHSVPFTFWSFIISASVLSKMSIMLPNIHPSSEYSYLYWVWAWLSICRVVLERKISVEHTSVSYPQL